MAARGAVALDPLATPAALSAAATVALPLPLPVVHCQLQRPQCKAAKASGLEGGPKRGWRPVYFRLHGTFSRVAHGGECTLAVPV
jgi:hypothetical protein